MTISVTQPRDSDDVSPYCSTGEYSGIRAVARADSGDGIGARVRSFNDKASLHQSTPGPASPITELTNRNQIFTEALIIPFSYRNPKHHLPVHW